MRNVEELRNNLKNELKTYCANYCPCGVSSIGMGDKCTCCKIYDLNNEVDNKLNAYKAHLGGYRLKKKYGF